MRWPWSRTGATPEAESAVEVAREHLAEAKAIRPEAQRVAASLRKTRETNGFLLTIQSLFDSVPPWVERER